MKNNYDDESFFTAYQQMARSQKGLTAAGEWPAFQKLLPNLTGQTVLDLGCGYGWHCLYAAEHGAKKVIGVDLSAKMLAVAQQKNHFENVTYQQGDLATVTFPKDSFDLVMSSLAIHYVPSFETLLTQIQHYLKPGGQLLFSVEHPLFTASGTQDWIYDQTGAIEHFPVDHYFEEGVRETNFLGSSVTKYHRTLTTYLGSLLRANFVLEQVIEPTPPAESLAEPGMKDEFRRPMMLIISARKAVDQ